MKLLRLVLALTFVTLFAHVAAADSTDPVIGFGGTGSLTPTCSGGTTTLDDGSTACDLNDVPLIIQVTIPDDATSTSTYIVDIYNATGDDEEGGGTDIYSLTITDPSLAPSQLGCEIDASSVYFTQVTKSGSSCTFTGDLPSGDAGGISLEGFAADSTVSLFADAPEPSSILLLGIGLLFLFGIQKRRGIAKSEA